MIFDADRRSIFLFYGTIHQGISALHRFEDPMFDVILRPASLVLICGLAYAAATFAMKTASTSPSILALGLITVCLTAAVLAEVLLLQRTHLSLAYIAILGIETLIIMTIAGMMGEGLNLKQALGAVLVLAGAAVIST